MTSESVNNEVANLESEISHLEQRISQAKESVQECVEANEKSVASRLCSNVQHHWLFKHIRQFAPRSRSTFPSQLPMKIASPLYSAG